MPSRELFCWPSTPHGSRLGVIAYRFVTHQFTTRRHSNPHMACHAISRSHSRHHNTFHLTTRRQPLMPYRLISRSHIHSNSSQFISRRRPILISSLDALTSSTALLFTCGVPFHPNIKKEWSRFGSICPMQSPPLPHPPDDCLRRRCSKEKPAARCPTSRRPPHEFLERGTGFEPVSPSYDSLANAGLSPSIQPYGLQPEPSDKPPSPSATMGTRGVSLSLAQRVTGAHSRRAPWRR